MDVLLCFFKIFYPVALRREIRLFVARLAVQEMGSGGR